VPIKLVQHIGFLHIATHTLGHRSLPTSLEKVAVGVIVEAIHPLRHKRTSFSWTLLIDRQLGIFGSNTVHHHKRSIVVDKPRTGPMIIDDLVHATNEIRERHIQIQLLNDGGVAHDVE